MHRTADRLDAALRDAVRRAGRAALALGAATSTSRGSRTLEVVARGKHLLHRFDTGRDPAHPPADGGPVARRAPGRAHRARAAPPRPAGRRAHRHAGRPSACAWACSTSCPPPASRDLVGHLGPDVLGPDWDADGRGGARHGIRRASSATPCSTSGCSAAWARSGPARSSSSSGCCRGPPAADLDPERVARDARPAAPAHGRRPPHRLAGEHRHPAVRARRPTCTRGRGGRAGAAATPCGWR